MKIKIINDDEYEKNEDFYLELGNPTWHTALSSIDVDNDPGRPILSSHPRCKIVITEDKEFAVHFIEYMIYTQQLTVFLIYFLKTGRASDNVSRWYPQGTFQINAISIILSCLEFQ